MEFSWPKETISSDTSRKALRQAILESIHLGKSGHPGGSLSLVEIMSAIFDGHCEFNPKNAKNLERDRIVLSKGHGVPALYATLSFQGFFAASELKGLRQYGHFLQGHPDKSQYPLMEASTGSLGQGLSIAIGLALGLSKQFEAHKISRLPRVYCILGDGEMQEGQVWEALLSAAKFKPGNLVCILDYNKGQIDGPVQEVMNLEPIKDKLEAFQWDVEVVNGHEMETLQRSLSSISNEVTKKPKFIIANTVKGKGVSFMEHPTKWHGAAPNREQLESAIKEIWGTHESPIGRLVQG